MARDEATKLRKRFLFVENNITLITNKVATRFTKLCGSIFGDRAIDVRIASNDSLQIWVTIKFKKFEITNSSGHKHTILDFYVRFGVKVNDEGLPRLNKNLQGQRETFELKEMLSNYAHSHLPGISEDFRTFCFGEASTPINMIQVELQSSPSWIVFEMFLHQIKPFIEWESLEGVPHVRMNSIAYPQQIQVDSRVLKRSITDFIKVVRKDDFTIPINYTFIGNNAISLQLQETPELIQMIFKASQIKGVLGEDGVFRNSNLSSKLLKLWYDKKKAIEGRHILFKGKKIPLKIIKPEINFEAGKIEACTHAHPEIQKYIIGIYNRYLNDYAYNNQNDLQIKGCNIRERPTNNDIYEIQQKHKGQIRKEWKSEIFDPIQSQNVFSFHDPVTGVTSVTPIIASSGVYQSYHQVAGNISFGQGIINTNSTTATTN
jgi:hypothetical protein